MFSYFSFFCQAYLRQKHAVKDKGVEEVFFLNNISLCRFFCLPLHTNSTIVVVKRSIVDDNTDEHSYPVWKEDAV